MASKLPLCSLGVQNFARSVQFASPHATVPHRQSDQEGRDRAFYPCGALSRGKLAHGNAQMTLQVGKRIKRYGLTCVKSQTEQSPHVGVAPSDRRLECLLDRPGRHPPVQV